MKKFSVLTVLLVAFAVFGLIGVAPALAQINWASTSPVGINILPDGSVDGTDNIKREGNLYTLTADLDLVRSENNFFAAIAVQKDNIVIDGAGHYIRAYGYIDRGVDLTERQNVTVKNLVVDGFVHGIYLWDSMGNVALNNTVVAPSSEGFQTGFWVSNSQLNRIEGNSVTGFNEYGMLFQSESTSNQILHNTFADNKIDLYIGYCANNTLTGNQLNSANNNLEISYHSYADFYQKIDTSNTIRERPIYYWINVHDRAVPLDAGFVGLGNCSNIIVQNLDISGNSEAVILHSTTNTTITQNRLSGNGFGVSLDACTNVTVTENTIISNGGAAITLRVSSNVSVTQNFLSGSNSNILPSLGISLLSTNNCKVSGNNITRFDRGISLASSADNLVSNNYIAQNSFGSYIYMGGNNVIFQNTFQENSMWAMQLSSSQTQPNNNLIYYNNFLDNIATKGNLQISNPWYFGPESNLWDNGTYGNYWSDYYTRYPNASEIGNSGIGDTFFEVNPNNIDHYPLTSPLPFPAVPTSPLPSSQPTQSPTPSIKPSTSPTPSPSIPEFPIWATLAVLALTAAGLTAYKHKKPNSKTPF
ncbi:MAG: right-handed parallel beta-helix repeat-containing protein [Candidatus Bathyarchaeota archaeon]|nr:right-handed parallel beta-helix repeat-containing protein [Candidatus Bathyarchaeota archaeon]